MKKFPIFLIILFMFLFFSNQILAEVEVKVSGTGNDTYIVYKLSCPLTEDCLQFCTAHMFCPDDCDNFSECYEETKLVDSKTMINMDDDGKIISDSDAQGAVCYKIVLNNVCTNKTPPENGDGELILSSAVIFVLGKGINTYTIYDKNEENKLGSAKTNEYKDMFSGTYTVKLNNSKKTGVSPPVRLYSGSILVRGWGIDQYSVNLNDDELAKVDTREELEFFPDTYTIKLNNTIQSVNVFDIARTTLYAGGITILDKNNGTTNLGNSTFTLYKGEEEISSKKTGEIIEVFPGDYILELNKIKKNISITETDLYQNYLSQPKSETAATLTFQGTGNDTYYIYLPETTGYDSENALTSAKTNENIDMFPDQYTIRLNNINKNVDLNSDQTIVPGTILVSGDGEETYYALDADGNQLGSAKTGKHLDVFGRTYTISLNNTQETILVTQGQETSLYPVSITISGTGDDEYFVYDLDENQVKNINTNQSVNVFQGNYKIKLNNTSPSDNNPLVVAKGQEGSDNSIVLNAGYISVSGKGENDFYVFDAQNNQLAFKKTNEKVELFPDNYIVKLNNTIQEKQVTEGINTPLVSGAITVLGQENDSFLVYDSEEKNNLAFAQVNSAVELFPDTYVVKYNNASITKIIEAGDDLIIKSGSITISGSQISEYYVYDEYDQQLAKVKTSETVGLFPGTYKVKLNNLTKIVNIEQGKNLILASGTLTVLGQGENDYYVYDSSGNTLVFTKTNESVELFAGTYTVSLNKSEKQAVVFAGEDNVQEIEARTSRNTQDVIDLSDALAALQVCAGMNPELMGEANIISDQQAGLDDAIYILQVLANIRIPETILKSGALQVEGQGLDIVYIYNAHGEFLAASKTSNLFELFAGDYTIKLNNVSKTITVKELETISLNTGIITVSGTGNEYYNIYDLDGNRLKGNIKTNTKVELFPGDYVVELDGVKKTVLVEELKEIVVDY